MTSIIDDEYLDDRLQYYGLVSDQDLEKTFLAIVEQLLGYKSEIEICLWENLFALAATLVGHKQREWSRIMFLNEEYHRCRLT